MSGLTKCPSCKMIVPSSKGTCENCGADLDPQSVVCPNCLKEVDAGNRFCRYCGTSLTTDANTDTESFDWDHRTREEKAGTENQSRTKKKGFGRKRKEKGSFWSGRFAGRNLNDLIYQKYAGKEEHANQKDYYPSEEETLYWTRCPVCGKITSTYGENCKGCGGKLNRQIVVCPYCKMDNKRGDTTCRYCGKDMRVTFTGFKVKT